MAIAEAGASEIVLTLLLPVKESLEFDLETTVCSIGFFMMAPNRWDPSSKTLTRPLRLPASPFSVSVRISQPSPYGHLLVSVVDSTLISLTPEERLHLLAQVRRMLRVSEENDAAVIEFHKLHSWSREKGFGRIFRSPTLFEDMVKCILLCNCQWSRTLSMARALCELQLELIRGEPRKSFHPKTPVKKEPKRKRGSNMKMFLNMKMEFGDHQQRHSPADKSQANNDNQIRNSQARESCSSSFASSGEPQCDTSPSVLSIAHPQQACHPLGNFPSPEELVELEEDYLAKRCGLGYRAKFIKSLAKGVVDQSINLVKLENDSQLSYNELDEELSRISGFGPFTRANVLVCMGFYSKIPVDTETIRHLRQFHKRINCTNKSVQMDLEELYAGYGQYQYLAFWFEIWNDYERRFGKLSEMPLSQYGRITASNMK